MISQSPDTKTSVETPIRAPSAVPVDDAVLPFEVDALDLRGRLTRLGPALDDVLAKHDYPPSVAKLLGEAIVLTTLLGSSLKFDGRFILQTQTDGPVSFLIVDFQAPDRLRAYARFDKRRLKDGQDSGQLLGKGHLAMTIDQGADMSRYQGLVALEGGNLEDAAHEYFLRSEQIPTRVRLAVGEEWRGGDGPRHSWRAGAQCRDGQGRQGRSDLRVLLIALPVHASGSGRGIRAPGTLSSSRTHPLQPFRLLAAGRSWKWAMTVLQPEIESRSGFTNR